MIFTISVVASTSLRPVAPFCEDYQLVDQPCTLTEGEAETGNVVEVRGARPGRPEWDATWCHVMPPLRSNAKQYQSQHTFCGTCPGSKSALKCL